MEEALPEENSQNEQAEELEVEKKRIHDEFNTQRAKMKELFLQKENELARKAEENLELNQLVIDLRRELDDLKSQLLVAGLTLESNVEQEKRKANEEIASLQHFIHETVEESSSTKILYDSELRKLQAYNQQLQHEIAALRQQRQHSPHGNLQESSSLAPSVVLNALTKGIVKKLGASDAFSESQASDEKKDDPDDLQSLIGPLEDQIHALKEKLRSTDEQLQKCQTAADPTAAPRCDMCANYEAQLVNEQQKTSDLRAAVRVAEASAERHKEDLLKEIGFRRDMEERWSEKTGEHRLQVGELTTSVHCAEQDLREVRQLFEQAAGEVRAEVQRLRAGREAVHADLVALQRENDNLVGKYAKHSAELQSEAIDLPNTVEELHELVLKVQQELIIARIGQEAADERLNTLKSDVLLLRDQITNDQHEKECIENNLVQEIDMIKAQKNQWEKEKRLYLANQEKLVSSDRAHAVRISELEKKLYDLETAKKRQEELISELKNRVFSLQQELDTSETVQKDFVRLSQSLQVQLEKIRESDTQVRWQHDEDVRDCPNCSSAFGGNRRKEHCRHCGQIFCLNCLTHTVDSGASMQPSRVCDVCHTLLVKSSAPYFSEAPPSIN